MPGESVQTAGELRAQLVARGARWSVSEHLADGERVPRPSLGLEPGVNLTPAAEAGTVDLRALVGHPSGNPHLTRRRAAHGLLTDVDAAAAGAEAEAGVAVPAGPSRWTGGRAGAGPG
ncbi:Papain family cysteine protease OS=Streptomyces lavendulae subsp. lavendulae OX=58340 GN=SLAV_19630 PE=3 SV=1 [Streptomyces lavendulae subsp. lavendulae]